MDDKAERLLSRLEYLAFCALMYRDTHDLGPGHAPLARRFVADMRSHYKAGEISVEALETAVAMADCLSRSIEPNTIYKARQSQTVSNRHARTKLLREKARELFEAGKPWYRGAAIPKVMEQLRQYAIEQGIPPMEDEKKLRDWLPPLRQG